MRLYLDACCYNRPFDDRTQNRIYDEANAVLSIIKRAEDNHFAITGSSVLEYEIGIMRNEDKKDKVTAFYNAAITEKINLNAEIARKAHEICNCTNIRPKDALELASAEEGEDDIFLTTDDRLIKMGTNSSAVHIRILNPVDYLSELAKKERMNEPE